MQTLENVLRALIPAMAAALCLSYGYVAADYMKPILFLLSALFFGLSIWCLEPES